MSVFGDLMTSQAVKSDEEILKLRAENATLRAEVERLTTDAGCSMAARVDLGHGKDGHCDVRNEACPPKCLLKQIRHLESSLAGLKGERDALEAAK